MQGSLLMVTAYKEACVNIFFSIVNVIHDRIRYHASLGGGIEPHGQLDAYP